MYKQIKLSIYLKLFNLLSLISAAYIEVDSTINVKPMLDRNNVVNKGLWIRNNRDRKYTSDFIFRANSLDTDNVLQNNYEAFGPSDVANSAFFSRFNMERNKRSINDKAKTFSDKVKCDNINYKCPNKDDTSKGITTQKPTSVFNADPYETAVLLSKYDHMSDFSEQDTETYKTNDVKNSMNFENAVSQITNDINNKKTNKSHNNRNNIPKRSMDQHEYETELIKKSEDFNVTDNNKLDRTIFDKEAMSWNNAHKPSMNTYKILRNKEEGFKHRPINERALVKVLSMLTKTFKKIMKQHHDIKNIHNKLCYLNDGFTKNAELLTSKFDDFNSKYMLMMNLNEELKTMQAKINEKERSFNNREIDLHKNLKEFVNQQKKFLAQQQEFYNMQKLMLAQNEKINLKQHVISKTQSEISHRQNDFARVLKKAKQIYIDSRNLSPTKLNTFVAKPKVTKEKKIEPVKVANSTFTINLPPPTPTTEIVKINLFSIPTLTRLENQDQLILDEKDYQPIDELIYKYYFNNTFIDDLMRNKILKTFIAASEGTDSNVTKSKRNEKDKLKTTLLIPVNNTGETKKHRSRRWVKHAKRNNQKKDLKSASRFFTVLNNKDNINKTDIVSDYLKNDLVRKVDPFITMALNFCKEIRQNVNLQELNWCVEKALRRLKVIDLKMSPLLAGSPPATLSTGAAGMTENEVTSTVSQTTPIPNKLHERNFHIQTTEGTDAVMYFPDNDELEIKLKEYELKPDIEGTVYYDGSLHASDIARNGDDSGGFSDVMPGLDSNSRVQVDSTAFNLQAQRQADVRKINERLLKIRMD